MPLISYAVDPGVVIVRGPDASSFLQSLLSQDLDPVAVGASVPALLLQPQGKLIATMDAVHVGADEWWLRTDANASADLAAGLTRFKIRVKADIVDVSGAFGALAVRGTGATARVHELVQSSSDLHLIPIAWGTADAGGAVDIVGARAAVGAARDALAAAGIEAANAEQYEAARIAAGVPRLGVDIDDTTIPQEAFLEKDAVSFTKGCFVGQELVCRIDTRGHVNKFLRHVHTEGATPPAGAELVLGEKVVGSLTSTAGSDALAMVRREVEPPAEVVVRWPGHEAKALVAAV